MMIRELSAVESLAAALTLWALLSMGSAVVGLRSSASPRWRAFWLMTGLWGLVDGGVALYAFVAVPLPPDTMRTVLLLNAGLDAAYIAVGAFLLTRPAETLRGFGAAVVVQELFLLALDLGFASRVSA